MIWCDSACGDVRARCSTDVRGGMVCSGRGGGYVSCRLEICVC